MTKTRIDAKLRGLASLGLLIVLCSSLWIPATEARGIFCTDPTRVGFGGDGWIYMDIPAFPSGPAAATNLVSHPMRPQQLFATNGVSVVQSQDGGCTWVPFYAPADGVSLDPMVSPLARIEDIVIPESREPSSRVYLVLNESQTDLGRAWILTTTSGGERWERADAGLPPVFNPRAVVPAPSDPNIVYALLDIDTTVTPGQFTQTRVAESVLYRSESAGASWVPAADPATKLKSGMQMQDLDVDPAAAANLWAATNVGLFRSEDGGATWQDIADITQWLDHVDVARGDDGLRVFAAERVVAQSQPYVWLSTDGQNFHDEPSPVLPEPIQAVDHGGSNPLDIAILAGDPVQGDVRRLSADGWVDIKDAGSDLRSLYADKTSTPALYSTSGDALLIYPWEYWIGDLEDSGYNFPIPPELRQPPGWFQPPNGSGFCEEDPEDLLDRDPPTVPPSSLLPTGNVLNLPVGQEVTVPYVLDLPSNPTPTDVFFLVDSSGSMQPTICGLLRDFKKIVGDLEDARLNVAFGIAEFKDYPIDVWPMGRDGDYCYRRRAAISIEPERLQEELDSMRAYGGGTDAPECQLVALHAMATGQGRDVGRPGPSTGDVKDGQEAAFREGTLRIVLHATDVGFHNEPHYPAPSYDEVLARLNEKDIHHVGISIIHTGGGPADRSPAPPVSWRSPRDDLERMARGTGAMAPAGGVDCNGDQYPEIQAGDELVCDAVDNGTVRLAPAVVNLIRAISDEVDIDVTADAPVVEAVDPAILSGIDVKVPNVLDLDVTYKCDPVEAGQTFEVPIVASIRGNEIVRATTTIVCGLLPEIPPVNPKIGVAVAPPPPPPPVLPNPAPASQTVTAPNLAPAPAPQPAPATQAQAQAQSQSQAQSQAATQANPAAVAQKQEQPQAALVHAAHQVQERLAMDHAMLRAASDRPRPFDQRLLMSALSLGLLSAYGFAVARLVRVPARVHRDETRRPR